jgi:hypothetical protein
LAALLWSTLNITLTPRQLQPSLGAAVFAFGTA